MVPSDNRSPLRIERYFTARHDDPFFDIAWASRTAEINSEDGSEVFRAEGLEFPSEWSQTAVNIVADKYFRVTESTGGKKETSAREMVLRIARTIADWGVKLGHLQEGQRNMFRDELAYILIHQIAMFNSPVLFNVGTRGGRFREEQCSACFINSVDDTMDSILELAKIEGRLYKGGSGSGVNYSPLRSSREKLSFGGFASGPVPFVAKDDANAGGIKSGGGTRRAAKMVILNADHGDIFEFVECKAKSEKMAHALIDAGFDGDFRARFGAYQSVPFQNANHSVRVTDEFMQVLAVDGDWKLMARDGKTVIETVKARKLWNAICEAAWGCGDPGLQFDTTINRWHPTPEHGRINGSNPCSEYMSHDDSACNLASINVRRCCKPDQSIDVPKFEHVVDIMITAQEIIVDGAKYPTPLLQENATKFRQLGLGYANLGAWFMSQGISYDSDRARGQVALLTALMTGRAYRRSSELALTVGPFPAYAQNREHFLRVMKQHQSALDSVPIVDKADEYLCKAAVAAWIEAIAQGSEHGFRNSQATVIAPTGTIGFAMDCDTTGIEPELNLRKKKKLVGGGSITIANQTVEEALRTLRYSDGDVRSILDYVVKNGSVVGSVIRQEHLSVFDSSFSDPIGKRALRPEAHILMLAAAQPFVSGAISKTCNIPDNATVEDVGRLYQLAWSSGLKAVALYRDGSKRSQPLQEAGSKASSAMPNPVRRKMPDDADSKRHKFNIGDHEGYIHAGVYEDGSLGEIFVKMAKQGSTVSGLMDGFSVVTSLALQYGVPLEKMVEKFAHMSFEPSGFTGNKKVGRAASILDYVFRHLESVFLANANGAKQEVFQFPSDELLSKVSDELLSRERMPHNSGNACPSCGHTLQRTGSCHTCPQCGWNGGCG